MALTPGARLGPYEVVSALGAGGMGEVYRARDTRLDRTVAIKILPDGLTADPQFRDRFDREARVISQLEHPHICALYDVGTEQGAAYLVMQYLEGETLADRLARGALPADQAIRHAVEIAGALDKAHRAGVVHRDLKPANVMLTKGGAKLLDFGLAKVTASRGATGVTGLSMLPTTPALAGANLTVQGTILGTFQYMAPEQLEGHEADARTDVFAFGALLYEMLTGKKAFEGKSQASLISSIMSGDPAPVSTLQPLVPPALDRIVNTCLAKDPDERWQSAGDIERQLRWTMESPSSSTVAPPVLMRQGRRRWMMPAALTGTFVLGALMAASGAWLFAGGSVRQQTQRLSVVLPAATTISFGQVPALTLALSPDGTAVAYSARQPNEQANENRLVLRTMDALLPRVIEGTQGARQPFFSPDGRWIGFFTTEGSLKKVSLAGGNPITLVEKINGGQWGFATWTDEDEIVYALTSGGLMRVSADGGPVKPLTTLNAGEEEVGHALPESIRGRGVVLFTVGYSSTQNSRIDAVVLATGERRTVVDNARNPHVLDAGYLLFQRDDAVLLAPFDAARLTLAGRAVPIVDDVRHDGASSEGPTPQLAVSRNGTLAFVPASDTSNTLLLVGRDGKAEPLGVTPGRYDRISASPDGRQIAASVARGADSEVHVFDLQRGSALNLTHDGSDEGPSWRNSRELLVTSRRRAVQGLFLKDLSGTEQLLVRRPQGTQIRNASWSPDGSVLAYTVQDGGRHDIWTLTMGEKDPKALLNAPASEHSPRFSPSGRWLAYVSDESGRGEIYVRRYPRGDRFVVSTQGGAGPVWARDGQEIYFQGQHEGEAKVMAVTIREKGDALELGTPTPLFPMRAPGPDGTFAQYAVSSNGGLRYDVLPDGRFVMVRGPDSRAVREIVLVQHWLEEVRRLTAQ